MKNFVAGSGGRYVYSEDFENLQALSLSINSIFEGCDNFVISGCTVSGSTIASGYVWINGNIRFFEGSSSVSYPYYIYETNSYTSTEYKDEPNKLGRINYLCAGGISTPTANDPVTGALPSFIEITSSYTPKINDKFFGRYAMILNHPFSKQTVAKNIEASGDVLVQKNMTSNQSVGVANTASGYVLKSLFKSNGDASLGLYLNNALITEVVLTTSGLIKFLKGTTEIASLDSEGITTNKSFLGTFFKTAKVSLSENILSNYSDSSDNGSVAINYTGYNGGTTKFRDFSVYDGKGASILYINGKSKRLAVSGSLDISGTDPILKINNSTKNKDDVSLLNTIRFYAMDTQIGAIGFNYTSVNTFYINNQIGSITLLPSTFVNVSGELRVNNVEISTIFVSKTDFNTAMGNKVSVATGMGLSQQNFTTILKNKLDSIVIADVANNIDGLISMSYVQTLANTKLTKTSNLSDLSDKVAARSNLQVPSLSEMNTALGLKLNASEKYTGVTFTTDLKTKLDGIIEGRFESKDDEGNVVAKVNGYVTVNKILFELNKYAPLLLDTYTPAQKKTVAGNLNVYTKEEANSAFVVPSKQWDEYINYITSTQSKTTDEAKAIMRAKINAASTTDLDSYLKKGNLLSDLELKNDADKKSVCNKIGAALASEYQPKINDTGWIGLTMTGLYARQIGNIVCIQGQFVANVDGGNAMFELPNTISPPAYSVQFCHPQQGSYSNDRNFIARIDGGQRKCMVIENRLGGYTMAFTLTYMV